jgi:hypothetical protein
MYNKIVVPLDGSNFSEQVLPYARVFADAYHAPVELLRITDPDTGPAFWPPQVDDRYLGEIVAKHFRSSVHVTTAAEIRWLIGSVAAKVIQTAANPLLLIRPVEGADSAAPVKLDTVFVPLDGSGLAEITLPHVCALAKTIVKIEIHLVRVYTLPVDACVAANGVIAQGSADYREGLKREAEAYLDRKVAGLRAEGFDRVVATAIQGTLPVKSSTSPLVRQTIWSRCRRTGGRESDAGCWAALRKELSNIRAIPFY